MGGFSIWFEVNKKGEICTLENKQETFTWTHFESCHPLHDIVLYPFTKRKVTSGLILEVEQNLSLDDDVILAIFEVEKGQEEALPGLARELGKKNCIHTNEKTIRKF